MLSGDGTPPDDGFEWREVDATWFQVLAYIGVIIGEMVTGLSLAVAGYLGLRRARTGDSWAAPQRLTMVGCTIGATGVLLRIHQTPLAACSGRPAVRAVDG